MIVFEKKTKNTILYWPVALIAGIVGTLCIVWVMTRLITPQEVHAKLFKLLSIDFIQINNTQTIEQSDPVNETPPPPVSQPKILENSELNLQMEEAILAPMQLVPIAQPALAITIEMPSISKTELSKSEPSTLPSIQKTEPSFDTELYPILTNEPAYPSRAKRAQLEGWVNVAFTITIEGKVEDIEVLAAQPEGVFENSTLKALKNWHFKPQMLSGKPQARRVVQTIQFELRK